MKYFVVLLKNHASIIFMSIMKDQDGIPKTFPHKYQYTQKKDFKLN